MKIQPLDGVDLVALGIILLLILAVASNLIKTVVGVNVPMTEEYLQISSEIYFGLISILTAYVGYKAGASRGSD